MFQLPVKRSRPSAILLAVLWYSGYADLKKKPSNFSMNCGPKQGRGTLDVTKADFGLKSNPGEGALC